MNNNIKKTLNRACHLKEKEKMKRKKTLRKTRLTSKIYCTLTVVTSLLISPSVFLGIVERANTQARASRFSSCVTISRSLNRTLVSFRSDVFCNHPWFAMSFSGSNSRQSRFTYDYWGLKVSEAPAPGLWTRASNCKNSNRNLRTWEASVITCAYTTFLNLYSTFETN